MKLAFVFPGQGSQSIGMMDGFSEQPIVRQTFDEASEALGDDLWAMCTTGTPEQIALTANTQPLMLTADIAVYRAWCEKTDFRPALVAGHSLGEYAALVAAGALTLSDAVPLVRFRANAMQTAVPESVGAMAAILALDDAKVVELCQSLSKPDAVVEAVNFNGPGQVVVAGHKAAVEALIAKAKEAGAKRAILLPVSAPFHSSLMAPAAAKLAEKLETVPFTSPRIPVLHNVDVSEHHEPEAIRRALAQQAAHPVQWTKTLREMISRGVTDICECGPGKVLAGLNKRGAKEAKGFALNSTAAILDAMTAIKGE